MAYSKVLNRPMFNKHNSAYGRGIASNLVTDEQRQKFNYGGRVGYAQKGYVPIQTKLDVKNIGDLYTPKYFEEQFEEEFIPKLQRKTEQFNPYTQSKTDPLGKDPMQFMFSPYISEKEWEISETVKDDKSKKDYYEKEWLPKQKEKYQKRINKQKKLLAKAGDERLKEFDDPVKEELEDLNLRPEKTTQTTDKYSDLLDWSPQEKQEKIGQMQLAMAERLIGGSRDKWGSTAQMKNLAGALGDVRKITDKEDIRKDQRKYRAAAEMYKDVEEHKLAQGRTYDNLKIQLGKVGGAEAAFGVKIKTFGENMKEKQLPKVSLGDIIYDERSDTFKIVDKAGSIETWRTIDVTDIPSLQSSGELRKLKSVTQ